MKKKTAKMITESEVIEAQEKWGNGIVKIGKEYMTNGDFVETAREHISKLYGYNDGNGKVLFKPTKCQVTQFRPTFDGALSYFVGHEFAQKGFPEDKGFAIAPFVAVRFVNPDVIEGETRAIAMGNYFFTTPGGESVKVEYTFGYRRGDDGDLVIDLHHSSLPFSQS